MSEGWDSDCESTPLQTPRQNYNLSNFGGGRGRGYGGKKNETFDHDTVDSGFGNNYKPRTCFKCHQEGHISRHCPQANTGGGYACYKCGEEGHMGKDCPTGGVGEVNAGNSACFNCKQEGHKSRNCPNPKVEDPNKPAQVTYIPTEIDDDDLFNQGVHVGTNFEKYHEIPVKVTGLPPIPDGVITFKAASLRQLLLDNIKRAGYVLPTPIQKRALTIIKDGRDIMACAQTGSGKTAAFLLPILHHILENNIQFMCEGSTAYPTAVIVSPTRELAIQIFNEARKFSMGSCVKCVIAYGGVAVAYQSRQLLAGCHILVATPGRLLDFIRRGLLNFRQVKFIVLDEADKMLDMGFAKDVETLITHSTMPDKGQRQTLMFSATFPAEIQSLASNYLNNYLYVTVGLVGAANSDVTQAIMELDTSEKRSSLITMLNDILAANDKEKILIFVDTKKSADFLAAYLSTQDISSTSIHGDRYQCQREEALSEFKNGVRNVLVATAVASRGLDIKGVGYVINYDLPKEIEEYIHRIGRTGRVGNAGKAISFFTEQKDAQLAKDLVKVLTNAGQESPEFLVNSSHGIAGQSYSGHGQFASKDIRKGVTEAFGGPSPCAAPIFTLEDEEWD